MPAIMATAYIAMRYAPKAMIVHVAGESYSMPRGRWAISRAHGLVVAWYLYGFKPCLGMIDTAVRREVETEYKSDDVSRGRSHSFCSAMRGSLYI